MEGIKMVIHILHSPGRIEAISKEKKGIWILRRIVTELRGELYASLGMQSRESDGGGGTAGCWSSVNKLDRAQFNPFMDAINSGKSFDRLNNMGLSNIGNSSKRF